MRAYQEALAAYGVQPAQILEHNGKKRIEWKRHGWKAIWRD